MELLVPRPLCEVVNCDVEIDVEAALAQLGRGLFRLLPEVYAYRYDFAKVTPSMINDMEFCPRLLWTQRRLGLKLISSRSLVPLVRGVLLHERYQRAVSQFHNVIVEYKIELGNLVGVVDLAIKRKGRLVPVEIKSGGVSREAHRKQLQIYIAMLRSRYGYLVYGRKVEIVHEDRSALETLKKIREVINSTTPPPAECDKCIFKPICRNIQP